MLNLEGQPYSLKDYPFAREIYDAGWRRVLLMCGRQVSKTITLCGHHITDSVAMPHFRNLYIAPLRDQASYYSKNKLGKIIGHSPKFRDHFVDSALPNGVWNREFIKGAEIIIRYAQTDPDRARGISSDRNSFDEIQDIIYDLVVPVVNETLANSKYGWEMYCGTPKSIENPIQSLWDQSTQREWLMKCSGCGRHNFVTSEKSVGKHGIICVKCSKYLNPREGFWYPMNPWDGDPDDPKALLQLQGYHVSQFVLPTNVEQPHRWARLLQKLDDPLISDAAIANEVFGVSYARGSRFLLREDLERCCRAYSISRSPRPELFSDVVRDEQGVMEIYAGVDWSGGGSSGISRTSLWIWGVMPDDRLKTLHFEIFPMREPSEDIETIAELCRVFNVKLVGADAGVGALANSILRRKLGRMRVMQFQYGSYRQHFMRGKDRILVDRTAAIDSYMAFVKQARIFYPNEQHCQQVFSDALSLHTEVTRTGTRVWTKRQDRSDDSFHAQLFGWIVCEISRGRVLLYGAENEKEHLFDA
jgi:hypothetical protein